jgi:hypothetical protein
LWAGGLLIGLGGALALVPGTRRRATDAASAPPSMVSGTPDGSGGGGHDRREPDADVEPEPVLEPQPEPEPVGVLAARRVNPA